MRSGGRIVVDDRADAGELFRTYRSTGDRTYRNQLIDAYTPLAAACARRFARRGEPLDDLVQVAVVGLLKAVERFDPSKGVPFEGFAIPTILGELRRHFRDSTWSVHVPRRAKDRRTEVDQTIEQLTHELGRRPHPDQVAGRLGWCTDDVLAALAASAAYRPGSLDAGHDPATPVDDPSAAIDDRLLVESLLHGLGDRERRIVELRYFEGLTQAEIAALMGLSQVHVSRLLRSSLDAARAAVAARPDSRWHDGPPARDSDVTPDSSVTSLLAPAAC
jgi:RNA polymerase sigma-B factor